MLPFGLLLAVIWGCIVAAFIQFTPVGRFMANRMTWFLVALGMGGDLLIMLLFLDGDGRILWWQGVAVIALSSIAVSAQGIAEFYYYFRGLMGNANQNTVSE